MDKKVYNAWSKRDFSASPEVPNPRPLVTYALEVDELGNKKFVKTEPVSPSMAEDFSIINNALYKRNGGASIRMSTDPVDFESQLSKFIDE